jgi:DNA-binding transcriptional ArsR family regulator
VDSIFNALGDPARVAIVEELAERDSQSLFELCARLISNRGVSMSRQAIAKHLAVMRDAGLIQVSSAGRTTVHSLDRDAVLRAREWMSALIQPKGRP